MQVGNAAHEIGHALGFFHTQSRHDRDSFITLYAQNFMISALGATRSNAKMADSLIPEIAPDASVLADMVE
ncbi:hypothetical protein KIN20_021401 [Parelaphostrongylus tenuis]|uniref:Peptidase M12A domain-containing protein n=1 Tax=Parelaphostrongylus tenuis TaxID=148309 RepID=A0AAD5M318_PARTN|nr:hypothetical protein KIN20_007236 [Parelaphostrongylus tenuis]KAJ1361995.1 hypothetical protein KIN20_021401 [Parelaphostrongylus tenuis]